jgi:hypothetical protein
MTYLMSRANYARCTAGMTAQQIAEFSRDFAPYPEGSSPDGQIDQRRIASAYLDLLAAENTRAIPQPWMLRPDGYYIWPKGNGKSWRPSAPWTEVTDGMYTAPAGTMWPFELFLPDPGPAPTITELAEEARSPWPDYWRHWRDLVPIDELTDRDADDSTRRYFLNGWVEERQPERSALDDLRAAMRTYRERLTDLPGPRRVACGERALSAFQLAGRPATVRASDQMVVNLTGIPIVADSDLPADAYQLIDAVTGEVLLEGFISPALAALIQQMRDDVDDLAARADTPPDLLGW